MQNSVAAQQYYDACPSIVQQTMEEVSALTGRSYNLFDYYGHPEADRVAVVMGSASSTVAETVDALNAKGERTGMVKVRLFRPWSAARPLHSLLPALSALPRREAHTLLPLPPLSPPIP